MVRNEKEVREQEESIVQASNIPQPIEQTVRLSRRNVDCATGNKPDICEEVKISLLLKLPSLAVPGVQIEVVCLFLLPVLNKICLVLNRVQLDLNVLHLSFISLIKVLRDSGLSYYGVFVILLCVQLFLIVQNIEKKLLSYVISLLLEVIDAIWGDRLTTKMTNVVAWNQQDTKVVPRFEFWTAKYFIRILIIPLNAIKAKMVFFVLKFILR